jgi:putative transposase
MAIISPKPGSLAAIIRSYKSAVTKNARLIYAGFDWQFRFHDHIIRDDNECQRITNYIRNNPDNWEGVDLAGINNFDRDS